MNADIEKAQEIVDIDPVNLDKECIRLPSQYLKYAHAAADAKRTVAEKKRELDVVKADAAKDIRANPQDYAMDKVTDAAVLAALTTMKSVRRATDDLQEAEYQAELLTAVVWAIEHKKRSLTLLVDLHGMGYFSSPKVTPAGKEAVEKMTQDRVRRRHQED